MQNLRGDSFCQVFPIFDPASNPMGSTCSAWVRGWVKNSGNNSAIFFFESGLQLVLSRRCPLGGGKKSLRVLPRSLPRAARNFAAGFATLRKFVGIKGYFFTGDFAAGFATLRKVVE